MHFATFRLVLLISSTAIISVGALNCNLCIGSPDSECAKNVSSVAVRQTCLSKTTSNHLVKLDQKCVFIIFRADEKVGDMVQRGCGYTYPNKDICAVAKQKWKNVEECGSCDTDMCN